MSRAFLGLGANLGNKEVALKQALALISASYRLKLTAYSSLYKTAPWGLTDQPAFLNAVAEVETELPPRQLLQICQGVEQALGRARDIHWGPRAIDIDILLYDNLTVDEADLKIPHPYLQQRAFVLIPLQELAPHLPLFALDEVKKTIAEGGSVTKFSTNHKWRQI